MKILVKDFITMPEKKEHREGCPSEYCSPCDCGASEHNDIINKIGNMECSEALKKAGYFRLDEVEIDANKLEHLILFPYGSKLKTTEANIRAAKRLVSWLINNKSQILKVVKK